ncbi:MULTISPECIES: hypothetical protein [Bacillus cereus group]|uniref:Uncharacterized protein n=1 Tax=Bacillus cereus (strain G9842) TaxID=405531 RepID=B7IZK0_BACC2|nr:MULTISPECIES: hypothetical protein [Bacillus cereus group]ACK98734.1 hypothetical protein BCG9842_A0007 [Bacillus cereus G9842]MCU5508186.1 hypothetical protein [Bacillus cereus]MDA2418338.1 hypothetical protein [Bacillus cereus]MDR4363550.1 hypothetical protein [Bacillus cereus]MDR4924600.1 hypothetical protein [Bacillus thuringiensis]
MATYTVNQPGSSVATFPASLKRGDKMILNNTSTGRFGVICQWKVPYDGLYTIEAWGAKGGGSFGGKGARMKGDFNLQANQIINLAVGQEGIFTHNGLDFEGGGGGGSFIVRENIPLLIAGGGGGQSSYSSNQNIRGSDGSKEKLPPSIGGGKPSKGEGLGGSHGGGTGGAGGSGFYSNGYNDGGHGTYYGAGGYTYSQGLFGGEGYSGASGSFGGGGGIGGTAGGGGGGYTGGHGAGNASAFSAQGAGSFNTGINQDNESGVQGSHGRIEITFIGSANEPPTKPSLTKQPISKSMNLSNEIVPLEWTASTDPEGNSIAYEMDFYNGTAWISIAKNIIDTNYDCILPSVTTDKAQLRIRANDSENGASEYVLSNIFSVAKQLYVIKDGNINKSYKNGNWEFI